MSKWQDDLGLVMKRAKRIAVLGVGSVLCGDDSAGMIVARRLKDVSQNPRLLSLEGSTAPENFTGLIRDFNPDLVLLVDAAYIDGEVGEIALISPVEDIKGLNFSTHMLPFSVLGDYLKAEVNCQIAVIGIKPGAVEFGTEASETIYHAAEAVAAEIVINLS